MQYVAPRVRNCAKAHARAFKSVAVAEGAELHRGSLGTRLVVPESLGEYGARVVLLEERAP